MAEGLGVRLKRAREAASLSQVRLAKMLGLTPGAIRGWETGLSHPTAAKLTKVAEVLGCSIGYLMGDDTHAPMVINGGVSARDNAHLSVGHGANRDNGEGGMAYFASVISSQQATIAQLVATVERLTFERLENARTKGQS